MSDDILKVHHFAFGGYADYYLREDHFIYDDLNQPLNSKKYKYTETSLIHFQGEKDYYFFYNEDEKYDLIFAMFHTSDSFIQAIKNKVASFTQYQLEGFEKGKMKLKDGKYFTTHSYQGHDYIDLFKGSKDLEKRFIYAPSTDFTYHLDKTMIDNGIIDLNIGKLKSKVIKGRKRSRRNRLITRIIGMIVFALIWYLLIQAGYFK